MLWYSQRVISRYQLFHFQMLAKPLKPWQNSALKGISDAKYWIFVSLINAYVEILTPKMMMLECGDFGKCLCHEGEPSWIRLMSYERVPREISNPSPMGGHSDRLPAKPGNGPSPKHDHADALILGFPAFYSMRNKCLLFLSHPVCSILLWQPE